MTTTVEPKHDHASSLLQDVICRNRNGEKIGVYAVCSAHPSVIDAAIRQSMENGSVLLVESTSSQVNQFGVTRDRRLINSLSLFTPLLNKRDSRGNACCWAQTISGRIRGGINRPKSLCRRRAI
jgi:hypothetical protein